VQRALADAELSLRAAEETEAPGDAGCQPIGLPGITDLAPDRGAVRIRQVILDLDAVIVSTGEFEHAYQFKGGVVERMDLRTL
jgi:hypothetical protein